MNLKTLKGITSLITVLLALIAVIMLFLPCSTLPAGTIFGKYNFNAFDIAFGAKNEKILNFSIKGTLTVISVLSAFVLSVLNLLNIVKKKFFSYLTGGAFAISGVLFAYIGRAHNIADYDYNFALITTKFAGIAVTCLGVGALLVFITLLLDKEEGNAKKAIAACVAIVVGFSFLSYIAFSLDYFFIQSSVDESNDVYLHDVLMNYDISDDGTLFDRMLANERAGRPITTSNSYRNMGISRIFDADRGVFLFPQIIRILLNFAVIIVCIVARHKMFGKIKLQTHKKKIVWQLILAFATVFGWILYVGNLILNTIGHSIGGTPEEAQVLLGLVITLNTLLPISSVVAIVFVTLFIILVLKKYACSFASRVIIPMLSAPIFYTLFFSFISTKEYVFKYPFYDELILNGKLMYLVTSDISPAVVIILSVILSLLCVLYYHFKHNFNIPILLSVLTAINTASAFLFFDFQIEINDLSPIGYVCILFVPVIISIICVIFGVLWFVKLWKSKQIPIEEKLNIEVKNTEK